MIVEIELPRYFDERQTRFLFTDALGSVTSVKSVKGGDEKIRYDAWGGFLEKYERTGHIEEYSKRGVLLGYNGKPFDSFTELYNYGYRHLDTDSKQWLTVDPIRDGSNWHAYLGGVADPVKYTDPKGLWVDRGDGSFTAEKGDTLWGLGQETGRDWQSTGFDRDSKTLQIGETVSFGTSGVNNSSPTVDSTSEAISQYYNGNGESVNLGQNTQEALKNNPDQQYRQNRITSGQTTSDQGNYGVNMTGDVFHVGDTVVEYYTTSGTKYGVTTFTGFVRDGFWDILPGKGDGIGPKNELPGGKPYAYIPYSWTISYPNPNLKEK